MISRYSEYFFRAFKGGFVEGRAREVKLPRESVDDVALFLHLLYAGKLVVPTASDFAAYDRCYKVLEASIDVASPATLEDVHHAPGDEGDANSQCDESDGGGHEVDKNDNVNNLEAGDSEVDRAPELVERQQRSLVTLCIFADRRNIPQLRNDIVDVLAKQREADWPMFSSSVEFVGLIYSCLPAENRLRRYIVDEAAFCWDQDSEMVGAISQYPSEFSAEVLQISLQWARRKDGKRFYPWWQRDMCRMHDHKTDAEKELCKDQHQEWHEEMLQKHPS
jgi:hypothetical protein